MLACGLTKTTAELSSLLLLLLLLCTGSLTSPPRMNIVGFLWILEIALLKSLLFLVLRCNDEDVWILRMVEDGICETVFPRKRSK